MRRQCHGGPQRSLVATHLQLARDLSGEQRLHKLPRCLVQLRVRHRRGALTASAKRVEERGARELHVAGGGRVLLPQHALLGGPEQQLEQLLGPHDAMNRLLWRAADGADRVHLLRRGGDAVVAAGDGLADRERLPHVARGARFDQRHLTRDAQAIHVSAGPVVIQRVEHQVELAHEFQPKARLLHVAVVSGDFRSRIEPQHRLTGNDSFGLSDMVLPEQELAVQVRHVDAIQIDHLDALKAGQHKRLEQLAPDTPGSNDENL
mmetsp:Transcript_22571/g.72656  ORF Transcript_22571/g.72656 Transcript_22571/m.72656 type:complete len:263 (-) Transcript_22571:74-862(-)